MLIFAAILFDMHLYNQLYMMLINNTIIYKYDNIMKSSVLKGLKNIFSHSYH